MRECRIWEVWSQTLEGVTIQRQGLAAYTTNWLQPFMTERTELTVHFPVWLLDFHHMSWTVAISGMWSLRSPSTPHPLTRLRLDHQSPSKTLGQADQIKLFPRQAFFKSAFQFTFDLNALVAVARCECCEVKDNMDHLYFSMMDHHRNANRALKGQSRDCWGKKCRSSPTAAWGRRQRPWPPSALYMAVVLPKRWLTRSVTASITASLYYYKQPLIIRSGVTCSLIYKLKIGEHKQ